ncbi:unnamed protein product [Trichobilharzia regenti]|nr:unnamed protein product [Trichobilharzia regenti]
MVLASGNNYFETNEFFETPPAKYPAGTRSSYPNESLYLSSKAPGQLLGSARTSTALNSLSCQTDLETAYSNIDSQLLGTTKVLSDRFGDFLTLPSERCLSATQAQNYPTQSSVYEWDTCNTPARTMNLQNIDRSLKSNNLNGLFILHVIAGKGLNSTHIIVRDLYCVIEMDSVRKARSMIRTSTSYFEWNEVFELDMEDNRFLAILLYQWDPRTKHRLCFYGGIDLKNLLSKLTSSNSTPSTSYTPTSDVILSPSISIVSKNLHKIALQLEPRGVLYLELGHIPLDKIFHRNQHLLSTTTLNSTSVDRLLFGVSIDELIERERVICQITEYYSPKQLTYQNTTDYMFIPLFIRKCVEEIDKRGSDVSTLKALVHEDAKAIKDIIQLVDLSAQRIPDIHAITGKSTAFM